MTRLSLNYNYTIILLDGIAKLQPPGGLSCCTYTCCVIPECNSSWQTKSSTIDFADAISPVQSSEESANVSASTDSSETPPDLSDASQTAKIGTSRWVVPQFTSFVDVG